MTNEKLAELTAEYEKIGKITFNKLTLADLDRYNHLKDALARHQQMERFKLAVKLKEQQKGQDAN